MIRTPISKSWVENKQYELIPREDDAWQIRILEGEYEQCIISFGKLSINEENLTVKFDYTLDYTPVDGVSSEDQGLQKIAGYILHSVMVNAFDKP